jgi:TldD protein
LSDAKDLTEFGLEYAQNCGANYVEARLIDGARIVFFLQNGNVMSGAELPWQGIGFRVLVNGGLSFVSVDKIEKKAIKRAIDSGIKMARTSNPSEKIDFGEPVSNQAKWEISVKEKIPDVDTDTMLELLMEMDRVAENHNINTRANVFEAQSSNKYLVTSEGTKIEANLSMLKYFGILTAKGLLDSEQRFVDLTRSTGWEGTRTWLEEYDDQCARIAKVASQDNNRFTGKVDFVVGSEVVGIICHENCGHPSEGDRIMGREGAQAGESFWRDLKLGESRVGSNHVTILEDPTIPKTGGYYLYDDEGVKARERVLIKNGIINEPLLNREFGVKFGLGSNGAARSADFNREPIIRMANTYMAPGNFTLEELVEDVRHGIYMLSFTEWNIDDRRYQSKYVGFECYEIKDGEITDVMVRRPVMELTSIGLFSSVDGVTKDLNFDFPGICGKSDPGQGVPVHAGGGMIRMRDIRLG